MCLKNASCGFLGQPQVRKRAIQSGKGTCRDVPSAARDGAFSVKSVKMMERSIAETNAEAVGLRDRGADPDFGVAHGRIHLLALGKPGSDG